MDWNHNTALKFLDLYRERECLWNRNNPFYKFPSKRAETWSELSKLMEINEEELKKKLESLLTSFRRERRKLRAKTKLGSRKAYKSHWFAFRSMEFLLNKFSSDRRTCRKVPPKHKKITSDDNSSDEETQVQATEKTSDNDRKSQPISSTQADQHEKPPQIFQVQLAPVHLNQQSKSSQTDNAERLDHPTESRRVRDDCVVYGEHIAFKLSRYSQHTRNVVEHLFAGIIFKADMGLLEHHNPYRNHTTSDYHSSSSISTMSPHHNIATYRNTTSRNISNAEEQPQQHNISSIIATSDDLLQSSHPQHLMEAEDSPEYAVIEFEPKFSPR